MPKVLEEKFSHFYSREVLEKFLQTEIVELDNEEF